MFHVWIGRILAMVYDRAKIERVISEVYNNRVELVLPYVAMFKEYCSAKNLPVSQEYWREFISSEIYYIFLAIKNVTRVSLSFIVVI